MGGNTGLIGAILAASRGITAASPADDKISILVSADHISISYRGSISQKEIKEITDNFFPGLEVEQFDGGDDCLYFRPKINNKKGGKNVEHRENQAKSRHKNNGSRA
jgi:hypothetical protein